MSLCGTDEKISTSGFRRLCPQVDPKLNPLAYSGNFRISSCSFDLSRSRSTRPAPFETGSHLMVRARPLNMVRNNATKSSVFAQTLLLQTTFLQHRNRRLAALHTWVGMNAIRDWPRALILLRFFAQGSEYARKNRPIWISLRSLGGQIWKLSTRVVPGSGRAIPVPRSAPVALSKKCTSRPSSDRRQPTR